jgi:hypothetical protein
MRAVLLSDRCSRAAASQIDIGDLDGFDVSKSTWTVQSAMPEVNAVRAPAA